MVLGLVFTGISAVKYPVEVEVSGTAYFVAVLDEEGIDLAGGIKDLSVTLLPSSGSKEGVGIKVSFSINVPDKSASLSSIEVTTPLLDLGYYRSACNADNYVFYGVGSEHIALTPKLGLPGIGLTVYFADIVKDEVDLYNATYDTGSYFDDAVGLKVSVTNLDFFNITLFGAFYDTDTDPATSSYGYAAHLNLTGKDVLSGLALNFAFASEEATLKYLVEASYSKSFTFDPVTVTLSPYFVYSEGAPKFYKSSDGVNWDKKFFQIGVSAEAKIVEGLKIFGKVTPKYDLEGADFSLAAESGLSYSSAFATANAKISWSDALASATDFVVTGDVKVTAVEGLALMARARYENATTKFGYNVEAAYTYGPLTLGVFYGTLETPYDLSGDSVLSIAFPSSDNVDILDAATWFVYLKTTLAF